MTQRKALEAYVRQEIRRRVKPSLLRMADLPTVGQDLTEVFLDILDTMLKKEPHD